MATAHTYHRIHQKNSAGNPVWMDALRILLGLFLVIKGVLFLEQNADVAYFFTSGQEAIATGNAALLTSIVHIVGGVMIATGFLTRLALLCQFPIIIGGMLFVNPQRGINLDLTEILVTVLITGLLLFFMIVGPGRYSVDNKVLRQKKAKTEV